MRALRALCSREKKGREIKRDKDGGRERERGMGREDIMHVKSLELSKRAA